MPEKKKIKLGLKNLAMLPGYFGYIFVHLRQNARLRSKFSPKFLSTLGPNPARPEPLPEKPRPTYNSGPDTADEKSLRSKKPSPQFDDQKAIDDKKKIFSVIW